MKPYFSLALVTVFWFLGCNWAEQKADSHPADFTKVAETKAPNEKDAEERAPSTSTDKGKPKAEENEVKKGEAPAEKQEIHEAISPVSKRTAEGVGPTEDESLKD